MRARVMLVAAAILAAAGCKTSGSTRSESTARAGDGGADSATRDGQRVAVEAQPQAGQDERTVAEAQAAEQAPSTRPAGHVPEGTAARQDELRGRLALVDARNHEIAVDSGQATQQLKVAPSATITVDGKKAALSDLKQGQEVRVMLDQSGDGASARQIEVERTK